MTDDEITQAIASLDDDPDPLHGDQTPAVRRLAQIGAPAVSALGAPLMADSAMTRLHAQRAWESIVYGRYGFAPGAGFPDDAAEESAASVIAQVSYDFEQSDGERKAAVSRMLDWAQRETG
jgi:hypothetical protein